MRLDGLNTIKKMFDFQHFIFWWVPLVVGLIWFGVLFFGW